MNESDGRVSFKVASELFVGDYVVMANGELQKVLAVRTTDDGMKVELNHGISIQPFSYTMFHTISLNDGR